jgi:hypothetical protein
MGDAEGAGTTDGSTLVCGSAEALGVALTGRSSPDAGPAARAAVAATVVAATAMPEARAMSRRFTGVSFVVGSDPTDGAGHRAIAARARG